MNAPRVVRGVRGDFTASVHVLGRLEPGPIKTTHYDPYHGAGLIAWQDASGYLRLERAVGYINGRYRPYVNYELREGGRPDDVARVRHRRWPPLPEAGAAGSRVLGLVQPRRTTVVGTPARSTRPSPNGSRSASSPSTLPASRCRPSWRCGTSRIRRVRWPGTIRATTRKCLFARSRHRAKLLARSRHRAKLLLVRSRHRAKLLPCVRSGCRSCSIRPRSGSRPPDRRHRSVPTEPGFTGEPAVEHPRRSRAHPGYRATFEHAFGSDAADTRMTRTPASEPLVIAD